ncbi:UDP-4-amino-4,6-dideoxy-N-acetyl-beta-L-altrosamine transaminase [Paenibacillus jilunlii]|uniref:Aminotransferase DegT n=1 Tax=Paenibacillus jilunlii TaxID=682956 RepID=A0A1G9J5A4_9BACL|nr:UDP-4-amino-4,6-dideoxy-N-acetyl-beta-L-altrosamine transaminase [Paenibacillus jilunlii]KWX74771.1 aminotransferase DegT [Paenibacillus jilunlii]SDL32707.1 UDP-4-amino-4,6-dideoxy-N-acetyl-beta-L-altrosamine transaminase [Paenibacillus jilunlii]
MSKSKLAIHGGSPVRAHYLPYGKQVIDEMDIQSVIEVLQSDFITSGPAIEQFESEMAKFTGAKYAVTFSSGTAALHGACHAAGIGEGDEVITTPMTFAASANCVLYQGGKPVFVDIDPLTYNLDPKLVKENITEKTKAIIPVHFTGQPAQLDEITTIARENNLVVIEDAAHALGAKYKNKSIGSISDMTMFSFHPVKHITTGEGGMITTNKEELYKKLLQFRTHGITREQQLLRENHGPWYYEMQFLGFNYRITDIQASLGISQLKKIERFIEKRKQLAGFYTKELSSIEEIILPHQLSDVDSSWHLYILRLQLSKLTAGRKEIFQALQKENIGVNVHYIPVYLHPYYKSLGFHKGICPVAESCYEEFISLPLFAGMDHRDALDVVEAVKKVITHYSNK